MEMLALGSGKGAATGCEGARAETGSAHATPTIATKRTAQRMKLGSV
jgi:hypothetical protein